jgi:polysaccharide pyruvyl transferase WcaK-like protein/MoaA/NifB/PqqE/SkfB family radical SAM enzyme
MTADSIYLQGEGAGPGWSALLPVRPKVINFQVNDVCNARCVMCFIWKNRKREELSPAQFARLLGRPYFSEVENLGITGGEPTLRADLAEYYEVALDKLPRLRGGHFITNGFSTARAIEAFTRVNQSYAQRGVSFAGMVSVDGVGAVHDRVRGRIGAFKRSSRTLAALRDAGVSTIACCTVVQANVYGLHDLLEWARQGGVYVRFRVAEFINRLYNDSAVDQIRAFDTAEVKHLVSFFHLLLAEYETAPEIRRTYASIVSLLSGGERLVACPYQSARALNVDSKGRYAHCAPKGQPHRLGPVAPLSLLAHAGERARIHRTHCPSCIHDYHADWTPRQAALEESDAKARATLYPPVAAVTDYPEVTKIGFALRDLNRIALIGWYGTETAGDIAILGGIVAEYLDSNPRLRFYVFSLFPAYTRLTVHGLGKEMAERMTVVPYFGVQAEQAIAEADAVVMAGGPLMDIDQTRYITGLFARFEALQRPRVIEGSGIGPLHVEQYRRNVIAAVRLATTINVRDNRSKALLEEYGVRGPIQVRSDPAVRFIADSGVRHRGGPDAPIRCYLRELTPEYPQATSQAEARRIVQNFVAQLAQLYPQHRIELWPMHYFPIGNDDRLFAQSLVDAIGNPRVMAIRTPCAPGDILESMASASFCVCMRFHSVVFADQIGAPYVAIDYTAGGKIRSYLADAGKLDRCLDFAGLERLDASALARLTGVEGVRTYA